MDHISVPIVLSVRCLLAILPTSFLFYTCSSFQTPFFIVLLNAVYQHSSHSHTHTSKELNMHSLLRANSPTKTPAEIMSFLLNVALTFRSCSMI